MPTSSNTPTKEDLAKTKILREYGIQDLERYVKKIQENIKVFQAAIGRERTEMKRTQGMIKALKKDIKTISLIQKLHKRKK